MYLYTLISLLFSRSNSPSSRYLSSRVMLQYIKQLGGSSLDTLQLVLWQSIPSLYCCLRLFCPRCSTFHLPSLNFTTFLLTHSSCFVIVSCSISPHLQHSDPSSPIWNHLRTYKSCFVPLFTGLIRHEIVLTPKECNS